MSSTDGYCSLVTFEEGEIGVPYKKTVLNSPAGSKVTVPTEMSQLPISQALPSQIPHSQPPLATSDISAGMNIHKATANQGGSVPVSKLEPRRIAMTTLGTNVVPNTAG